MKYFKYSILLNKYPFQLVCGSIWSVFRIIAKVVTPQVVGYNYVVNCSISGKKHSKFPSFQAS